jgi:hypothetical protein
MTASRDDVRKPRRYRPSFAALLAIVVAGCLVWAAVAMVLPRWDGSFVTLDAAVVSTASQGSGKNRTSYTTVRYVLGDGRDVTTTLSNSSVEPGATTVRIRYDTLNPRKALEDSNIIPYVLAMTMLCGAGLFLRLAHMASLHDGQKHFM